MKESQSLANVTGVSRVSGRIPAEVALPLGPLLHADSWIGAKLSYHGMAEIPAAINDWVKALNTISKHANRKESLSCDTTS